MEWVKVWQEPEEEYTRMMRGIERFLRAVVPAVEVDTHGAAIYLFIEPDAAPMWAAILRGFEHGWLAGYKKCVSGEYNSEPDVEYPEDGLHLFADVEEDEE